METIEACAAKIQEIIEENGKTKALLIQYENKDDASLPGDPIDPATIAAIADNLRERGIDVTIVEFDRELYLEWLGDRKDSRALRSAWAHYHYEVFRRIARKAGAVRSKAKAAAARKNGKKGGRPRKK